MPPRRQVKRASPKAAEAKCPAGTRRQIKSRKCERPCKSPSRRLSNGQCSSMVPVPVPPPPMLFLEAVRGGVQLKAIAAPINKKQSLGAAIRKGIVLRKAKSASKIVAASIGGVLQQAVAAAARRQSSQHSSRRSSSNQWAASSHSRHDAVAAHYSALPHRSSNAVRRLAAPPAAAAGFGYNQALVNKLAQIRRDAQDSGTSSS